MEETVFSIQLKYHIDEFEYQITKIIDCDGNIIPINRVEYFQLRENDIIEDILNWSKFKNFLLKECGVKNYSTVEFMELEYEGEEADILNVFFKKTVGYHKEKIPTHTLSSNTSNNG